MRYSICYSNYLYLSITKYTKKEVLFKNDNTFILYDYRYYCDFKIVINFVFNRYRGCAYSVPMLEYGHPVL